jgi:hypothetical protein
VSRRERTETIVECDACGRQMRAGDGRCAYAKDLDVCEYCVTKLLALPEALAMCALNDRMKTALGPVRDAAKAARP